MKKLIFIVFLLAVMVAPFMVSKPAAAAADPGCYEVVPVPGIGAAVGKVDCSVLSFYASNWGGAAPGECWIIGLSASGLPEGSPQPQKQDCATLTVTAQSNLDGTIDTVDQARSRIINDQRQQANASSPVGCAYSDLQNQSDNCTIMHYVNIVIDVLSAAVGIIVIIMIVAGGIQYITAGGDPQRVTAAKARIANAVLALVAFLFLFAFLQWIVPGGLF